MAISLKSTVGGGGILSVRSIPEIVEIPTSSTGELLRVTPPSGQRVVLTTLATDGSTQSNISIYEGTRLIKNGTLSNFVTPVDQLATQGSYRIGASNTGAPFMNEVVLEPDMELVISTSSTTSNILLIAYYLGE